MNQVRFERVTGGGLRYKIWEGRCLNGFIKQKWHLLLLSSWKITELCRKTLMRSVFWYLFENNSMEKSKVRTEMVNLMKTDLKLMKQKCI